MKVGIHGFMVPEITKDANSNSGQERPECKAGDIFYYKEQKYEAVVSEWGCIGCSFNTDEYCNGAGMPQEIPDCCGSNNLVKFIKVITEVR